MSKVVEVAGGMIAAGRKALNSIDGTVAARRDCYFRPMQFA